MKIENLVNIKCNLREEKILKYFCYLYLLGTGLINGKRLSPNARDCFTRFGAKIGDVKLIDFVDS